MQSCGGECRNLGYLLHETAQALCALLPACPPSGGPECRLLTGTWLWSPGAHLVHVVLTFSLKSTDVLEIPLEKITPLYKRHRKKDRTVGNSDFSSWDSFCLAGTAFKSEDAKKLHEKEQRCSCRGPEWSGAQPVLLWRHYVMRPTCAMAAWAALWPGSCWCWPCSSGSVCRNAPLPAFRPLTSSSVLPLSVVLFSALPPWRV